MKTGKVEITLPRFIFDESLDYFVTAEHVMEGGRGVYSWLGLQNGLYFEVWVLVRVWLSKAVKDFPEGVGLEVCKG